jgi:hypothetical protein
MALIEKNKELETVKAQMEIVKTQHEMEKMTMEMQKNRADAENQVMVGAVGGQNNADV